MGRLAAELPINLSNSNGDKRALDKLHGETGMALFAAYCAALNSARRTPA
jgi:hypothetical protein